MQVCPGCGEENPDKFRLCGLCGSPLQAVTPAEIRKTVTVVFTDLKGSTSLGESLDSESLREVMTRYFDEMRRALERHGGTVEKYIGDAVMAVFGLPTLHEDDALRAVRAAYDMKQALAKLNREMQSRWGVTLSNRTGVNTGEVVAGDAVHGQRLVTGDAVNVAARLEQAAPECEVLIGEPTYRLARDAIEVEEVEPLELKGKSERVAAYRLVCVRSGAMVPRRMDLPIVGRERELEQLDHALMRAVAENSCRLLTVLAQAGVGKSRLLAEFATTAADTAIVLQGHCLAYGEGITFWPMAEAVRQAAGIGEADTPQEARRKLASVVSLDTAQVVERLATMMGIGTREFPVEEIFWAARKLLESLAADRPLVVVFEDVHWAEPTFLELIERILESARSSPILVLCTARPDVLERRAGWSSEPNGARIHLSPLGQDESAEIAGNLLGDGVDSAVRQRIADAAEGNPLFVEQMLFMLIDAGLLARRDGRWIAAHDLSNVQVPPTIQALIAARLDRLDQSERAVIEPASVVGRVFYRGAVEYLTSLASSGEVDERLGVLVRKEFVAPDESSFAGEDTFRFNHVLIRDAAYQRLLKRSRADLHERLVEWLARTLGSRLMEFEEIVGYHLEQAFHYLQELGPLDDHASSLGFRAADRLGSAGRRALARGDIPAAANLLQRAVMTLPVSAPTRHRLLMDLAEVKIELGEFAEAEALFSEIALGAARAGDPGLHAEASLGRLVVRSATDPEGLQDEVRKETIRTIAIFEKAGDHRGLAKAYRLLAQVHGTDARYGESEKVALQTIEQARLAGDSILEVRNYPPYAMNALYGPLPVADAVARCEQLVRDAHGDRRTEGLVLCVVAHLYAMQGRFEEARDGYRTAKAILDDLGSKLLAACTSLHSGPIEMLADDPATAERELRRDLEALTAMGERYLASWVMAYLGQAVCAQGKYDEASELSRACEEAALATDVEAQAIWRCVRARALAHGGSFREAESLAGEGVALVRQSDSPVMRADSLLDLAEVLRLSGHLEDSFLLAKEAVGLYELKGSTASVVRAERFLS